MQAKILTMLELQAAMNRKVHDDWMNQGFAWYRAIWIECAELMDHYGWKWWKKQTPDLEQVRLELVDIWHFGLSSMLQSGLPMAEIATQVEDAVFSVSEQRAENGIEGGLLLAVEEFASSTLQHKVFDVAGFWLACRSIGFDFDDLYRQYIGKNVLNFFRQDHGYKEGTYQKVWDGKEDNEHLMTVVNALDASSGSFQDDVYQALLKSYPKKS